MRVLALDIYGFRGISRGRLVFPDQVALVGPNGSGKSTIIDALSLVFGRHKLVNDLTEHDFTGSCPQSQDRIRIIATLGGFPSTNVDDNPTWFRSGRAVPKWWDPTKKAPVPLEAKGSALCAQIGYAARFDHEELSVKHVRYFHHDDEQVDPFDEDVIDRFPDRLLTDVGFFVLPARRTWAASISFGSELFRKAVATLGGLPATTVLQHRDSLRSPTPALEDDPGLRPLVENINARMAQLVPGNPKLQLRLTSTDSDSFLRALVPHYQRDDGGSLPAGRHGTGLISLQTLVLLLEIGRARRAEKQSFILAVEEPELHVPPGLQRRLIGDAAATSDQVICTTHSPRVAAFFDAGSIQLLSRKEAADGSSTRELEGRALAPAPMVSAPNSLGQLYSDHRARLVEALMFPVVLIPEGRTDAEWLRLMLDVVETGARQLHPVPSLVPPFGSVVGVVPTRDAAMKITFERLRTLHGVVAVLVDGDQAGDGYVKELLTCLPPPCCVVQWPSGWTIEDGLRWTLEGDPATLLADIEKRLGQTYQTLDDLVIALKNKDGQTGGLKTHYMAHEEIAGAMRRSEPCVGRVELLLEAITRAVTGSVAGFNNLESDAARSAPSTPVYRFRP